MTVNSTAAPPHVPDRDIVSWWGLVMEGFLSTHRHVDRQIEQSTGVKPAEAEVLLRLGRTPGHTLAMSKLASEVSLSSGGCTKVVDRLADAGLTVRNPCATDRRVVYVELTPEGRELAARVEAEAATLLRDRLVSVIGVDDAERLGAIMRRLRDAN